MRELMLRLDLKFGHRRCSCNLLSERARHHLMLICRTTGNALVTSVPF
jgi:hypothetical protein